jgi:predicted Zn finger-like uncharacterized protein
MDVRCEKCATEYEFDENRIGANGVTVKCTACGFVFKVRRPRAPPPRATTTIGKGPQGGREWLVRKPDGQMIAFRELTTLQKWIVEGRIARDDEISKNGETWKRLGNILELEPFFSVYEKARTLNTLMDHDQHLEIRGSEVLGASNPIPEPRARPVTHPRAAPLPHPEPLPLSQPPIPSMAPVSHAPAPTMPMPVMGAMPSAHLPPPSDVGRTAPVLHDPPRPSSDGLLPGNGMETSHPTAAPSFHPAPTQPLPRASSGGRAPAARTDFGIAPRSSSSSDLSFEIDDDIDTSRSERVDRDRGRPLVWVLLLLVVIGIGGGVALAIWGPEGNPVKALAIEYGLLPRQKIDDGAGRLVEDAQSAADLDTVASLQKAAGLLEKAEAIRPGDPAIAAERALVLVTSAAMYRRWAADLELASLAAEALEKRNLATPLLDEAFAAASAASQRAPDALEPARALAAYQLLLQDEAAYTSAIARAKAQMEKLGRVDPATLYLEAVRAVKDPMKPAADGIDRAKGLLEQALTTRPTMNRARVLLARIHVAKAALPSARLELDRVLATAPSHEEAKRLIASIGAIEKASTPPPPPVVAPPPIEAPPADAEGAGKGYEWWIARADSLRERDRTNAAMNAYGKAAELRPGSAEPHTGKGWCFLDLDRPKLALDAFDKAVKLNDRYVEAYYGLGESYRALGRNDEAIEAYEKYLARAPSSAADRAAAERTLERLRGSK